MAHSYEGKIKGELERKLATLATVFPAGVTIITVFTDPFAV
ncbi:hypothetical protein [Paenibacillus amylolyticus]|nr:hypothetical protein [Paenibacillus amylolyticus]